MNNKLAWRKVLIVGCGKSGVGAAVFLLRERAFPILFDENKTLTEEEVKKRLIEKGEELKFAYMDPDKVEIILKTLPEEKKKEIELVVLSPGVPVDTPFVEEFRKRGVPIWGEIELAFQRESGMVIAITGTNGKTTTTTLVHEIMERNFEKSFVMGNIGYPYTDIVRKTTEKSVTVGEISSFQLETIEDFHPKVSAILNITPDHLNRHHTMENYIAAKNNVTKNQVKGDFCILNFDNAETRKLGAKCPANVLYFSVTQELSEGAFLKGEEIYLATDGKIKKLMNIHDMKLVGLCNVENVMAAILISEAMGVPKEIYLEAIKTFRAVEHRIEFVKEVNGVVYYNDSKGTNPDAAIQAVYAMDRPTILIGGGYDKESSYDEWIEAFQGKVKLLVLIGQTKEKIAACARAHGFENFVFAETFKEAFQICVENAAPKEAVLLSPACASWGMFSNYEERGKLFKELVYQIKERA